MDQLQAFLDHGWVGSIIGIIGTVLGIASILFALWIYRASKIGPRPVFEMTSNRIIGVTDGNLASDIQMNFRGEPVSRLSRTSVVLWNSGNAILRGSDIVNANPVRFEYSKDSVILDARVQKASNRANGITIEIIKTARNIAIIDFDYLDPQDGAAFELLHTDNNLDPNMFGTIRGVPKGIVLYSTYIARSINRKKVQKVLKYAWTVVTVIGVFMLIGSSVFMYLAYGGYTKTESFKTLSIPVFLSSIVYTLTGVNMLWSRRRRYPKSLIVDE